MDADYPTKGVNIPRRSTRQAGIVDHRGVQKNFPRTLAAHIAALPKTKRVEIWFQDEARLGQKNGHARIWAKTGTRPRRPADQRYANAYLFGAICPMGAKGAALMLPFANTRAMQMHLDEISCNVAAKAHGVVLMDRAGWYSTDRHCQVNVTAQVSDFAGAADWVSRGRFCGFEALTA